MRKFLLWDGQDAHPSFFADRSLEAGANDYLSKPVKLKQLASTIQQLLIRTKF